MIKEKMEMLDNVYHRIWKELGEFTFPNSVRYNKHRWQFNDIIGTPRYWSIILSTSPLQELVILKLIETLKHDIEDDNAA